MTTHTVSVNSQVHARFRANERTALVIRVEDSDFQAGDTVSIRQDGGFWGARDFRITHVVDDHHAGIAAGHVLLSLEDSRVKQLDELRRENEKLVRSNRALPARARRLAEQVKS